MGVTLRVLQRILPVIAAGFAAVGSQPASAQSDYPNRPVRLDGRLHAGLGRRHHRPRARQPHEPDPRPAVRGREQAGRRLESRGRVRRAFAEGRLHAVPVGLGQRQQRGDDRRTCRSTSPRTSRRSRWSTRSRSILVVHPSTGVSSVKELIALAEVKARRADLRLDRHRHRAAHVRRAVHAEHRHQARACALPGQPAGGDRPAGRPRPGDVLAGDRGDLAGEVRPAQGAGAARPPNARRSCRTCRP